MNSNSRWVFTSNKEPEFLRMETVLFCIWQKEQGKGGYIHWQGYVEFYKSYTKPAVKRLLKSRDIHVEEADKTREENMFYILKPETSMGDRFMYMAPNIVHRYSNNQSLDTPPQSPERTIRWEDILQTRIDFE